MGCLSADEKSMINLNRVELDVLRKLLEKRVKFVIIGGRAVNFHGIFRGAPDLDLFYSKGRDNSLCLLDALRQFGGDNLTPDSLSAIVQINIYGNPIQLHSEIDGISFTDVYAQAVFVVLEGVCLPFISYAHLLENKRIVGLKSGRNKDLDDVLELSELDREK